MTYAITQLTDGKYYARIFKDGGYYGLEYHANNVDDILAWINIMLKGM